MWLKRVFLTSVHIYMYLRILSCSQIKIGIMRSDVKELVQNQNKGCQFALFHSFFSIVGLSIFFYWVICDRWGYSEKTGISDKSRFIFLTDFRYSESILIYTSPCIDCHAKNSKLQYFLLAHFCQIYSFTNRNRGMAHISHEYCYCSERNSFSFFICRTCRQRRMIECLYSGNDNLQFVIVSRGFNRSGSS